jgi:hypothetical protein
MTFAPNCFISKRWQKVGRQELPSTPYKQEIDPRATSYQQKISAILIFLNNTENLECTLFFTGVRKIIGYIFWFFWLIYAAPLCFIMFGAVVSKIKKIRPSRFRRDLAL